MIRIFGSMRDMQSIRIFHMIRSIRIGCVLSVIRVIRIIRSVPNIGKMQSKTRLPTASKIQPTLRPGEAPNEPQIAS